MPPKDAAATAPATAPADAAEPSGLDGDTQLNVRTCNSSLHYPPKTNVCTVSVITGTTMQNWTTFKRIMKPSGL